MAMFGPLSTLQVQVRDVPGLAAAFACAAEAMRPDSAVHRRILALAPGETNRVELEGGAFVIEQSYQSKPRPEGFFESHRKYVDLQLIVAGEELMEVADIARLRVSEPYVEERDLVKYADVAGASLLRMRPGDAALFFPSDGHMPSLQLHGPAPVRKVVVKIPVR